MCTKFPMQHGCNIRWLLSDKRFLNEPIIMVDTSLSQRRPTERKLMEQNQKYRAKYYVPHKDELDNLARKIQ